MKVMWCAEGEDEGKAEDPVGTHITSFASGLCILLSEIFK